MIRARFHIRKDDCDNDYRPVKWPIKYPYWCSAESSNSFVLVAYAEDEDSIKELWPEAQEKMVTTTIPSHTIGVRLGIVVIS